MSKISPGRKGGCILCGKKKIASTRAEIKKNKEQFREIQHIVIGEKR